MSARHSIRSGGRLAMGAACLPFALLRGRAAEGWQLISVDVFATLLCRCGDDDAAWREGAQHTVEVARERGLTMPAAPIALRVAIERRLSELRLAAGQDPEFSHQEVLAGMLRELGAGDWAETEAEGLAAWELEREIAYTRPIAAMAECVRQWAEAGRRVVVISDTRYTATELTLLLSRHGITDFAAIYASADHAASKFSGRLFDLVAEREGSAPGRILHTGDDLCADALAAAQRGLAVRFAPRPAKPRQLPEAPPVSELEDSFFAIGYQAVGPILAAFVRLLFQRARQDRVRRLAFVARDGELLLQVAQALAGPGGDRQGFAVKYLHLSRRAIACCAPELQSLPAGPAAVERVLATLGSIRRMGTLMESFQNYYNVPGELVARHMVRLGAERGDAEALRRFLGDPLAAAELAQALAPVRERLHRYLLQEEMLDGDSALVDIGWRATLQKILGAQTRAWEVQPPRGYYLGMWDENGRDFPVDAVGVLCDQRRGRGLREGSAWHAAFLLEALCRAKHGMVAGFVEVSGGRILPVHIEEGGTRVAERESEHTQERVQAGAIAYAKWFARNCPLAVSSEDALRREAQGRLYQLAFFPTPAERELGRRLAYSEPASDEIAMPLIHSPGAGLRGWLAGLRSPWKGGYLRSHGGRAASVVYCVIEGLVARLPTGTKPAIRRLLLRGE